jgi:hypothetical protein
MARRHCAGRWSKRPSTRSVSSPDRPLHAQVTQRVGGKRATLTVARKIGRRAYHVLRELETQAA